MGHMLHDLLGALKDKASLTKATLTTTATSSPSLAVLRATCHHPSTSPPDPHHVTALLSFGRSSRLSATTLIRSLSSRLSTTRDPSVALKSLICLHQLFSHGSFILVDTITSSLIPSSGRRSPLNLSSFRDPSSLALSSWVRWYARLIELLLSTKRFQTKEYDEPERLTCLLNTHLIAELDALVGIMEEINRAPDLLTLEQNRLVVEVARTVEEERVNMQQGILARVRELKERLTDLGFADSVELVCLIKRLEGCRVKWKGWDLFWSEASELRERVGEVIERKEKERGRVRREGVSESARIVDRFADGSVGFSSSLRLTS